MSDWADGLVTAADAAGTASSGLPWGSIIQGGVSLLGGVLGNQQRAQNANSANALTLYMSNTAHQREVADLKAAGLNPILSATHGVGATTAQMQAAQVQDVFSPAVSSAQEGYRLSELESQRVRNETAQTESNIGKQTAETRNIISTGDKIVAEIDNIKQSTQTGAAEEDLKRIQADLTGAQANLARAETATQIQEAALKYRQTLSEVERTLNLLAERGLTHAETGAASARAALSRAETGLTGARTQTEQHHAGEAAYQEQLAGNKIPGSELDRRMDENPTYGVIKRLIRDSVGQLGYLLNIGKGAATAGGGKQLKNGSWQNR